MEIVLFTECLYVQVKNTDDEININWSDNMKNYLHTYHALGLNVNNIAFDFLADNEILQWLLSKRIRHVSDIDRARAN